MRFRAIEHRPVVSAEDAEEVGEVVDVMFQSDRGDLLGLVIAAGVIGGLLRRYRLAASANLIAFGEDVITIDNKRDLRPIEKKPDRRAVRSHQVLGRTAVTVGGRFLGSVEDLEIDVKHHRVVDYLVRVPQTKDADALVSVGVDGGMRVGPDLVVVPDDAVGGAAAGVE